MNELTTTASREKVERLEEEMTNLPQVDCPVRHYFAPGLFAREITIPKGCVLVGAVHRRDNLAVLSAGKLQIVTDDGTKEISAPMTVSIKAGSKNCAVAVETAVWTNFFPNEDDEQNIDVLVERCTESKASDLLGGATNKQLLTSGAMPQLEA